MIQLIISFVSLFVWLLYETDWLRVNLMPLPIQQSAYGEMRLRLQLRNRFHLCGYLDPLCGWDWLCQHRDDRDFKVAIELRVNGSTHKLTLPPNAKGIIKEIIRINTKPHKPKVEIYPPSHYAWGLAGNVHH